MSKKIFKWAVIGAGGAGIAAVGKLLDHRIAPKDILWVDPYFEVGDLGKHWQSIDGNTSVKSFTDFLHAAASFNYPKIAKEFQLNELPAHHSCELKHIVAPLQSISQHLKEQVFSVQSSVHHLKLDHRQWTLQTDQQSYTANHVILAHGAVPNRLNYPEISNIPFHIAINKDRLSEQLNLDHTIAVFGSSHSAIMILKHLVNLNAKRIINFYRSPCRYAIELDNWTLFDNTGLKGKTAQWARAYIDGQLPDNLERYPFDESQISRHLPDCDQLIAAVGFSRRASIVIDGYEKAAYNPSNGIIAPGLFGLGIAYPHATYDPLGHLEHQVGLWKFMSYLNKIMPLWFKYPA